MSKRNRNRRYEKASREKGYQRVRSTVIYLTLSELPISRKLVAATLRTCGKGMRTNRIGRYLKELEHKEAEALRSASYDDLLAELKGEEN